LFLSNKYIKEYFITSLKVCQESVLRATYSHELHDTLTHAALKKTELENLNREMPTRKGMQYVKHSVLRAIQLTGARFDVTLTKIGHLGTPLRRI
jgi:hypothetical protein